MSMSAFVKLHWFSSISLWISDIAMKLGYRLIKPLIRVGNKMIFWKNTS